MEVIYTQFYKCSGRVRGRVVAKAGDRLWLDSGHVSVDDMAGADKELGLPLGD